MAKYSLFVANSINRLRTKKFFTYLVATATFIFASISGLSPANAATENAQVRISNISVTLDSNTNRYVIRMDGELINNDSTEIKDIRIVVGTENQIVSKYALSRFYESRDNANLTESNYFAKLRKVQANSKANWNITFFADDVLTFSNGLYGLGVNAYTDSRFSSDVVAIPLFTAPPINVMNTIFAVQLSTLNRHLANGGFYRSDVDELNRLTSLITNARDLEITWVVDPVLYQWLAELANTDLQEQALVLSNLLTEISGKSISSIYSQPDVSRLLDSSRDEDLINLVVRSQQFSGKNNLVLAPPDGNLTTQAINRLGELGVVPIVSNEFLTGDIYANVEAKVVVDQTTSLVSDRATSNCLRSNSDLVGQFQNRNCLISSLTLASIGQIKNSIVLTPADWQPAENELRLLYSELIGKTWLTVAPIAPLSTAEPTANFAANTQYDVDPFSPELLDTGDSILADAVRTASIFTDPNYADAFSLARLRGFSSLWESGLQAAEFLVENELLLSSYQDLVSIESSKNVTVSSGETEIPITIVNQSDRDITVSIALTSPQTSLFKSEPSALITVPFGKRVTVPMNVTLVNEGILNVTAKLYAPNGQQFGKAKLIQISSAEYQGLARTLVLVAFGLLILLSISNVVKRRRENTSS